MSFEGNEIPSNKHFITSTRREIESLLIWIDLTTSFWRILRFDFVIFIGNIPNDVFALVGIVCCQLHVDTVFDKFDAPSTVISISLILHLHQMIDFEFEYIFHLLCGKKPRLSAYITHFPRHKIQFKPSKQ